MKAEFKRIAVVMTDISGCHKILFICSVVCSRLQMLDHFAECIKQAKGVRQQAVQLNIFTAVLSALKVSYTPTDHTSHVPRVFLGLEMVLLGS